MKHRLFFVMFLIGIPVAAGETSPQAKAWQLEQQGKAQEAFLAYLAIPGCENAAARLARSKPVGYQNLLGEHAKEFPAPRVSLIRGDLLLAQGRKADALAAYRELTGRIAAQAEKGWDQDLVPCDYYPSEHARHGGPIATPGYEPLEPFSIGPGSHRDNWLIRRFIALEAWDDAAREFARIWELHRQRGRPHEVAVPVWNPDTKTHTLQKKAVVPAGFDGLGFQFAIDYAFFLKRQKQLDQALAVLLEPLVKLDMEKDPNAVRWGGTQRLSRKEFIRLAYGEFKTAKREDELCAALQALIDQGENRARRVLAQIRRHEGKPAEVLRLENEFIAAGNFDEWTSHYRRALVLEELQKNAEAAEEYGKLLAVAYQPPKLPDAEEEFEIRQAMCWPDPKSDPKSDAARAAYQSEILERLQRLYGSLGQPEKALNLALRQFDTNPRLLEQLSLLEQIAIQFRTAQDQARFQEWARQRVATADSPVAKANLFWLVKDYVAASKLIASTKQGAWDLEAWKCRFRGAGKEALRGFLQALLVADPQDAHTRLELLDLDVKAEQPDPTRQLELLLDSKTQPAFARYKGARNDTQFRNYYDLAYRLLRRYEKAGQKEKLTALGLRIAAGEKPFNDKFDPRQHEYRDGNGLPEDVNACLALAVQHLDPASDGPRFLAALKDSPWLSARRQLERRLAGAWQPEHLKPFGWANAPAGVTLLASNENVQCLVRDERYVYAGMPWGVAVYDFKGEGVTRIALGEAAKALAAFGDHVWAGTPKGLFRIDPQDWQVKHQWLDRDMPESERRMRSDDPHAYAWNNGVYALAADGELLWIGLHRNVQVLNTRTLELRSFSFNDLKIESWAGYERIYPEKDYVWADSHSGVRRYDRKAQSWEVVAYDHKPVRLIGDVDGTLYGTATLPEPLRARPCVINRETLEVTPLLIEDLPGRQPCLNGPFGYFGKNNGKPVFGPGYPHFRLEDGKLRALSDEMRAATESAVPEGLRSALTVQSPDGTITAYDSITHRHNVFGMPFFSGRWTLLPLPDGTRVLGGMTCRSPRYQYPNEDNGLNDSCETWDEEGGLYFIDAQQRPRRASSANGGNGLLGDVVYGLFSDKTRKLAWLCTNAGVVALNQDNQVAGRRSRADGLCCNRITAGVAANGKLYFAGGWNDGGGGLAVLDPHTNVFTSLSTADGLDRDFLQSLKLEKDKIAIGFGVEYERYGNFRYRQYPPAIFDPSTGAFTSGGAPVYKENRHEGFQGKQGPLPLLGGHILARVERGGKEYLCGTRGLVIRPLNSAASLTFGALGANLQVSAQEKLLAAAQEYRNRIQTAQELQTALQEENPFSRANALAEAAFKVADQKEFVPLLASQLEDPCLRVRSTALFGLTKSKEDAAVVPLLQARLADKDRHIRVVAALELARRGKRPDLKHFTELARQPHGFGSFPFGAKSNLGRLAGHEEMYYALATQVTPELFGFLLEVPPHFDAYDYKGKLLPPLGAGLRQHPEVAALLLKAYDARPYDSNKRQFAQWVFKSAGKEMLPVLHEALRSKDRVVRSNAARACGAIGDASSIPLLIAALDLESGLSRASIVWALGELKAKAALPQLANLYVDARNDRRRSGVLAAQSGAAAQSEYNQLRDLDSLAADWDELKAAAQPAPVDPEHFEELLNEETVLEAVRKIGAADAGAYYRTLAGDKDVAGRKEAAVNLADGNPLELEQNLAVLRGLASDPEDQVRIPATVSLLILEQETALKPILEWLASGQQWKKVCTVRELERVTDRRKLDFARPALQALADDPRIDEFVRKAALRLLH